MSYLWVNSKTSHVNKCEGDKNAMKLKLWHNNRINCFHPSIYVQIEKKFTLASSIESAGHCKVTQYQTYLVRLLTHAQKLAPILNFLTM